MARHYEVKIKLKRSQPDALGQVMGHFFNRGWSVIGNHTDRTCDWSVTVPTSIGLTDMLSYLRVYLTGLDVRSLSVKEEAV